MKSLRLLLIACILLAPLGAHGADVSELYRRAAATFHALQGRPSAGATDWRTLAGTFNAIYEQHPTHERAPDALFSAALSLQAAHGRSAALRDLRAAIGSFEQFVRIYPGHRLADDSLIHVGRLYLTVGKDEESAAAVFKRVVRDYDSGDQHGNARRFLAGIEQAQETRARAEDVARAAAARAKAATPQPRGGMSAALRQVRSWNTADGMRIELTVEGNTDYRQGEVGPGNGLPRRLFVDLADARIGDDVAHQVAIGEPVLQRIRLGRPTADSTRVVLDLGRVKAYSIREYRLPRQQKIVIDLESMPAPAVVRQPAAAEQAVAARQIEPPPQPGPKDLPTAEGAAPVQLAVRDEHDHSNATPFQKVASALRALTIDTIVIDPGHGGRDPGAVGFGMMEKDIALEIAGRLRDVIQGKRRGTRVSLTRERDVFVPLEERPRIAKRAGADLFISIHLNANAVERVSGIETYFLNPAQDDGSVRVAARENATSETRVGALNTILFDLMRDANILESSRLARQLQAALVGELRPNYAVRNLGVKQAPFMVLIGSEMPSVLVETGFITNRQESRRFRSDAYLNRIARGIYAGLADYIEGETLARLPPAPVKVAQLDNG